VQDDLYVSLFTCARVRTSAILNKGYHNFPQPLQQKSGCVHLFSYEKDSLKILSNPFFSNDPVFDTDDLGHDRKESLYLANSWNKLFFQK
jgi:hypothetical protein